MEDNLKLINNSENKFVLFYSLFLSQEGMFYSYTVFHQLILDNFFRRGLSLYLFDENIIVQWYSRYLLFKRWFKLVCFHKDRIKCCEHVMQLYILDILFILFTSFSSIFKVLKINQNKLKVIYYFWQVYCDCVRMCYFTSLIITG